MPWFTGSGEAVFVMATSASVGEATFTVVVTVLLAQFGSVAAEHGMLIFAEFEMVVGVGGVPGVIGGTP